MEPDIQALVDALNDIYDSLGELSVDSLQGALTANGLVLVVDDSSDDSATSEGE